MSDEKTIAINVFISYAHEDKRFKNALEKHLSFLKRQGFISAWNYRDIQAGEEWESEINSHLNAAQIILLLISPDFIASEYCYSIEMTKAMERHQAGEVRVIPIILRPTDWEGAPFSKLQVLPTLAKPVTLWKSRDEAFLDVVQGIRRVVQEFRIQPDYPVFSELSRVDWGEAPDPGQFYGREKELTDLREWIVDEHSHMVAVLGIGGIGKSSLVATLVEQVKESFDYVFWRALHNAPPLHSILQGCIRFFSGQRTIDLPEELDEQLTLLIRYLRDRRCLLILDNIESVLQAGSYAGQFKEGYEEYGKLLQRVGQSRHQSCLLLTSREKPKEVADLESSAASVRSLPLKGLSAEEGQEILKNKGLFGAQDTTLRLWSAETGEHLRTLHGNDSLIWSVSFSPNGKMLASSGEDRTIRLWDVDSGQCFNTLQGHTGGIDSIAFSPDGRILASGSDDLTVRVWEIDTGKCFNILRGHTGWIWSVTFSPNGKILASVGEDQTVRLWDVGSGQCFNTLQSHTNTIWSIVFSPDGNTLVSGSWDQTIRLWETSSGNLIRTWRGYRNAISSVAFSPDGQTLASGSEDHIIRLWNINSGQFKALPALPDRVWSVAFSPDGKILASSSVMVYLWDTSTRERIKALPHDTWVYSVAFSPDGKTLVSCDDNYGLHLWNVSSGQHLKTLLKHESVWSVSFNPNGKILASGGETTCLWDAFSGQNLKILREHSGLIRSVTFSPNGKMLASGSEDRAIYIWDVDSFQCLHTLQEHTGTVYSVAFSSNSKILASGSQDSTIKLWNVRTGKCQKTLQGHTSWIHTVAFSPDGNTLVSGSEDGSIKLWNIQTGECFQTLRSDRPYERMDITGITGLTEAQKASLRALGAIEMNSVEFA